MRSRLYSCILRSHTQIVESCCNVYWVLVTPFLAQFAIQFLRGCFFSSLFAQRQGIRSYVRLGFAFVLTFVLGWLAHHQSPFSECRTLLAVVTGSFPFAMQLGIIQKLHKTYWLFTFGKVHAFIEVGKKETAFWVFITAVVMYGCGHT